SNNVKSLTLDLSNETTEHSALLSEIIKYNSTLQSLNIRHLTTLSINSIFQALPVNNSLESLTLEGIKTLSDISSLFASICSNTSLKSLYIHRCNVKDQDLNFIETNSSLKTLSLDEGSNGDGFTFQGLEIMRKWLIQNSTLDTLKFRLNNNVDQKTVLSFIQDANNLLELDITVENYPTTDIYDGNNILELIPLTSSLCYLHLTHIISPGSTASTAYNTRIGSEILSFIHTEDLALYEKIYFAKRLAISPKALDFYREKKDAKTEDVDAISKLASFVAKGLSI
ncbi:leucine-rich repeat domain-containing protein, partial [Candidatus Megaera venefica]|uniref:hypothetical protein n=1 Tax=Candidatus Megaera venefica TaxID=2055910 RepID=UPI002AD2BB7A